MGVTLALQNHKPLIKDHRDVLRMVRESNSPAFENLPRRSLDAPTKASPRCARLAQAVGSLQSCRTLAVSSTATPTAAYRRGPDRRHHHGRDESILSADFTRAMHEIGYHGYTSYELCHQLPVVNGETVGIEFAHQERPACGEFMREIIRTDTRTTANPVSPQLVGVA